MALRSGPFFLLFFVFSLILPLAAPSFAGATGSKGIEVAVDEGISSRLAQGLRVELRVWPKKGEAYSALAERVTGDPGLWRQISKINEGKSLMYGMPVMIPFNLLRDDLKRRSLLALFPGDERVPGGWLHVITYSGAEVCESLWSVTRLFAGDGALYPKIVKANKLDGTKIVPGQEFIIPEEILDEALRTPVEPPRGVVGPLEFKCDERGEYAEYRIKKAEALYSAVVVRFVGVVDPQEVLEIADEVARRSGIADVRAIPVGYRVKIPRDLVMPEFLPEGDPRRVSYQAERSRARPYTDLTVVARSLKGVHVILDPGHGGSDPGAVKKGLYEDEIVYDIACRIKHLLETTTGAKVHMVVKDKKSGFTPKASLSHDRNEILLTRPTYSLDDATHGVRLRWIYANWCYYDLLQRRVDSEKILFTSVHADSLYHELRGASIYVPASEYCNERNIPGSFYNRFEEVKYLKASSRKRPNKYDSEGRSKRFAGSLIQSLRQNQVKVCEPKPIRECIRRKRKEFLPAVLRYNHVPTKVFVEVANLNNGTDRRRLSSPDWRDRFARAYVEALVDYYGGKESGQKEARSGR